MKAQREERVIIEKLAFGGAGIGRIGGKVCFVPFVAVGDVARVAIALEKKSYYEAELVELLEPAVGRVPAPCPVFGSCGGCNWQHLPYVEQLRAKGQIFVETLGRIARVAAEQIAEPLAAPNPYSYRSRVQIKVRYCDNRLHMGFYRQGSHYVIDFPGACVIAGPIVNSVVAELRAILTAFPEPERLPQIDVAVGAAGDAVVIIHYIGTRQEHIVAWLRETMVGRVSVTGIFLQSGRKSTIRNVWGDERLSYTFAAELVPGMPHLQLSFRAGGFSQVNYVQNSAMVANVLQWLELTGSERVLDLYCGNGNFSLPVAHYCAELVGVEEFSQSIEDAERNARLNGINNVHFFCRDAEQWLADLGAAKERFDVVLLDPPRTGAREAVKHIPSLQPEKIIYVSCDPNTLARDLAELTKSGYAVVISRVVDMFPQTYHMESITLLHKTEQILGEELAS
jgi:23S rRNA (uracil1939-C5)-methyltransferase